MAEIIASTVAVLLEKAVSVTANRIGLVLGFYKDLDDLNCYAKDVQAVLADAETKQSQNPIVLRWLEKVEGVAREASYVLDELLYESLRRQVKSRNKSNGNKVCLFFSLSKHDISFRWRMGSKVREINAKLKTFNLEATSVGLTRVVDALAPANVVATAVNLAGSRQTDSLALKFVAGRDDEISDIVERLLKGSSDGSVSVLPIIGMGGLGKTTVAKSVYNNEKINDHFGKKSWFCVSEQFNVMETLRGILESLKGAKVEPCGRDALVQQIQKELNRERFLFVLDDVWNEDKLLWDDFYNSLVAINTTNGSFCVVTTRLQTTANLVSTVAPFVLAKLLDDDCWSILTQRATRGGNVPEELKVLKNQILRRCQGLPLAANAVGGLLSLQSGEKWLSIVENQVLKVNEVVGEIRPILRLSFDNLPSPSIKKCFAYCSVYSKGTSMYGKKLVELWMAEGFLQDDAERRTTMEEVGRNYLTILLQSSLLEEKGRYPGNYKMHDLVHDLAESISKPVLFDPKNNYHVQHLELVDKYDRYNPWNARSPLIDIVKGYISAEFLSKFRYLHVLYLSNATQIMDDAELENLGCSISKLKHLRSLTISFMTESICKLYNLQTLRLWSDSKIGLPHGLSNLIRLRHIFFYYKAEMAPHMGRLTCLQTLDYFNVGKEEGRGIEELGFMKNLEGELEIRHLELVKGIKAAMADLSGKQNLKILKLSWNIPSRQDGVIEGDVERVLEGLEPHPNLRELSICGFMGDRFPSWWGKLSALVNLELHRCNECTKLPAMGRFPYLESLEIWNLNNVVSIGDSYYNVEDCRMFPSLKLLRLHNMRSLTEWKELQVEAMDDHWGQSRTSPTFHFPCLDRLKLNGYLKASVVKDVISKSAGSLRVLKLHYMSSLRSASDVINNHLNMNSLEKFEIYHCEELIDIDIPSSTSLRVLRVERCPKLVSCPWNFQHTPSLEYLTISECPNMFTTEAMPRGFAHLTNLPSLSLGPFTDDSVHLFDWSGLLGLSTLQSLTLLGFSDQRSNLPQQLQRFASLEELWLQDFASVESLPDWFGSLTSLRRLELQKFPELQYLPSASAMASLTNLQRLNVYDCPLLKQSWDNRRNDPCSEWTKISCLPDLRVEVIDSASAKY